MKSRSTQTPWEEFHGPNLGYLYEQYERYLSDKNLVDESFRGLFDQWGSPHLTSAEAGSPGLSPNEWMKRVSKLLAVLGMAANIRKKGHLEADINPIERRKPVGIGDMKTYGVTEEDVRGVPAEFISPVLKETCTDGLSAISYLKELYMNKIGEFVKQKRKEAGLTQEEFAIRSGLGLRFVRELEQGKETVRMDKVNQALSMFGMKAVPGRKDD